MRGRLGSLALLTALLLASCGGEANGHIVRVEVETTLVPAEEFDTVSTTLESDDPAERQSFPAQPGDNFVDGLQTAEFTDVPEGSVRVVVALLREGTVVVKRAVRARVDRDRVVEVTITASELGAECSPGCYCTQLANLACEAQANCCPTEPTTTLLECLGSVRARCETDLLPSLEDERTGYDPAVAVDLIGEARELVAECSPDVRRWGNVDFLEVMRGTKSRGTSCTPDPSVEEDTAALFSCNTDEDLTCRPTETSAWACQGLSSEGGPCAIGFNCRPGMYCDEGTCRPRLNLGAACAGNAQCASFLCEEGVCVEPEESDFCEDPLGE